MKLRIYTSENQMIKGCQNKEMAAQKLLFDTYAPKMLGICKRYIKDPHDAESMMIEGFTKVFDAISTFREDGSLEGWIRRIMINCCLGYLRKNKSLFLQVEISEANTLIDPRIGDGLEQEDLINMVERLPVGYRTVFNLYAIEGYSHKEIAKELGISAGTSKSQLSKARTLLQRFIEENSVSKELIKAKP